MIEALRHEDILKKVGGKFRLTALIQRRMVELLEGAAPLVERKPGMTDMELVIEEILQDKIAIDYSKSDIAPPGQYESGMKVTSAKTE
jgi:DNA-directed RNA polymerase subunit omega